MLLCYWFVVAAPCVAYCFAWAMGREKNMRDKAAVAAFFVVYIFCVCLRSPSVGVDTQHYVKYFESATVFGWEKTFARSDIEVGFQMFAAFSALFGGSRAGFILAGVIGILPIAVLYLKETEDGLLCCSFFLISLLFEFFFSGVRQGLAVGIGVASFYFVKRKKLVPFLLMVLLAASMHKSAYVVLVMYPLYNVRITQKWVPFAALILIFIYVFRESIFSTVLLPMLGADYLSTYEYLTGTSGQGSLAVLFVLFALYSCVMLDSRQSDDGTLGLRNILLLAAAIHMFTPLHPVVCRMNYYFIPFIPLALAKVNNRAKPRFQFIRQLACFVLPVYFVAYFLLLKADSLGIAPYVFCFQ